MQVLEQQYIDVQPAVSEALRQANMFAAQASEPAEGLYILQFHILAVHVCSLSHTHIMHTLMHSHNIFFVDGSSSEELAQLNSSVHKSNEEVGELVRNWSDLLRASQATANKFDQDYK